MTPLDNLSSGESYNSKHAYIPISVQTLHFKLDYRPVKILLEVLRWVLSLRAVQPRPLGWAGSLGELAALRSR